MTLHLKPETERLVEEELSRGHFDSVDEIIVEGITRWRERNPAQAAKTKTGKKSLAEFLMESPLPGSGLKLERRKDYPRTPDL